MLKSKKDVDKHVQDSFRKIKNEKERSLRCYNVAKLYYSVGEYECARHYVCCYLSVRPDVAGAHKLLGQALEGLKQKEKALEEYKCSLKLESRQPDLVLKVCDLIVDTKAQLDPGMARYWKERAEEAANHDPIVFKFKEYLIKLSGESGENSDLEQLIKREIEARPSDVALRVKLLRLHLENKHSEIAFKYAMDLEARSLFRNDILWYSCLLDVLKAYRASGTSSRNDWDFLINELCILERYTSLCLKEQPGHGPPAFVDALFELDQALYRTAQLSQCGGERLLQECVRHMGGQLCLHFAVAILRISKQSRLGWRESARMVPPLLLLAWVTPITDPSVWTLPSKDSEKKNLQMWQKDGAFRCSQAGYVLLGMAQDRRQFLLRISQQCVQGWREKIYPKIFSSRNHQSATTSSHFIQHNGFAEIPGSFPTFNSLKSYDALSQLQQPDSLHHLIWLGLQDIAANGKPTQTGHHITSSVMYVPQHKISPDFACHVFENLQFSTSNLRSSGVETFSKLDADTFLYSSVLCAAAAQEDLHLKVFVGDEKPPVLPVDLTEQLCTVAQAKWWSAAYRLYNNSTGSDLSEIRAIVQRGLEVIRVLGNHGMDVQLVVQLAKIFSEKASSLSTNMEAVGDVHALEARARMYWNCGLALLERLEKNQPIRMPESRLFSYPGKDLSSSEVKALLEEGRFFLACHLMKEDQHEKAIEAFHQLKNPYASFFQALIYKKLADAEMSSGDSSTLDVRSKHVILLLKSRSALHLTLDRLRAPNVDANHPLNAELYQHLEEVESLLASAEPDISLGMNRTLCDGVSDDSISSNRSTDDLHNASRIGNASVLHQTMMSSLVGVVNGRTPTQGVVSSTPCKNKYQLDSTYISDGFQQKRTEARPSPERLETQLRRLTMNNDSIMQKLIDQNRQVLDSNKSIVESLEKNRLAVEDLQNQVTDLRREVGRLKISGSGRSHAEKESDLFNIFPNEDDYAEELDLTSQLSSLQGFSYDAQYSGYRPQVSGVQALSTISYGNSNIQVPQILPPSPFFPQPQIPLARNVDPSGLIYHPHLGYYSPNLNLVDGQAMRVASAAIPSAVPSAVPGGSASGTMPGVSNIAGIGASAAVYNKISALVPGAGMPVSNGLGVSSTQALPVNVVITSSDVVPTQAPLQQPTLSVTIPPQHRHASVLAAQGKLPVTTTVSALKPAAPHNFQITMPPQANIPTTASLEKTLSPLKPLSTQALMPDIPTPIYSAVTVTSLSSSTQQQHEQRQVDFKASRVSTGSASGDDTYTEDADYNPCADFKPVIPLPEEVTVTTGEENETVLFSCRAKLFRFVQHEWRERGIGQIKILKHNETEKPRILMRREQVHKICANHFIKPDMELTSQSGSDRAWTWLAQDFADQEVTLEKLCVRFKTVEEASNFKEVFDNAREIAKRVCTPVKAQQPSSEPQKLLDKSASSKCDSSSGKVEFGGFSFLSAPVLKPVESPAKSATPSDKESKDSPQGKPSPFAGFSFTQSSTTTSASSLFGNTPSQTTSSSIFGKLQSATKTSTEQASTGSSIFGKPTSGSISGTVDSSKPRSLTSTGIFSSTVSSTTTPMFGATELTMGKISKEEEQKGGALFGTNTAIDFAALAAQSKDKELAQKNNNFKGFEGAGSMVFGKKPSTPSQVSSSAAGEEEVAGTEEEFEPTAVFNPVIPLPSLVEVKTGEEEEEVMFEERSKLLRFDTEAREWKERGVGKMKVLKDNKTGKVRLLMRREQVFKVCCNHYLTKDLQFGLMTTSDKAVTWSAQDFAEGEVRTEVFALRFKTPELMHKFKDLVEDIQNNLSDAANIPANPAPSTQSKDTKPLSELFKPKAGSWECSGCFTRNNADTTSCPCCNTLKPGCVATVTKDTSTPKFSFGIPKDEKPKPPVEKDVKQQSLAEMFKPKEGSWECGGCYTRNDASQTTCPACSFIKPGHEAQQNSNSGFNFGNILTKSDKQPSLSEMFKPKVGSWECTGCYSRNDGDKTKCLACLTPKPGHEAEANESSKTGSSFSFGTASPSPKYSFGMPATATATAPAPSTEVKAFSFGGKPVAEQTKAAFDFGTQSAPVNFGDGKSFTFGLPKSTETIVKPAQSSGFVFGNTSTPTREPDTAPTFGSPHKFEFEFRPKSPSKSPVKSPGAPSGGDDSDEEVEQADDIHFQPVIPLPDKVPVYTGEEDEVVLYSHRAKLFRFVDKEWKERGIGDIKILKHGTTGKVRLLMRREPILKLCLNHFLNIDLEVLPKDNKTWMWGAVDFSEGTECTEKFACRFKTPEIAAEFKQALDDAKAELTTSPAKPTADTGAPSGKAPNDGCAVEDVSPAMENFSFVLPPNSTNSKPGVVRSLFGSSPARKDKDEAEVEVVYEAEVSPEERAAALKLQLPEKFYAYKRAPPCAGCPGCEKDSDSDQGETKESATPSPALSVVSSTTPSPALSVVSSTTPSMFRGGSAVFGQSAPIFGSGAPLFGQSSFSNQSATPIFGGGSSTSIFSQKTANPVFGSGVSANPTFGNAINLSSEVSAAAGKSSAVSKTEQLKSNETPASSTPGTDSSLKLSVPPLKAEINKSDKLEAGADGVSFLPVNHNLTFSSLAAASPAKPAFKTSSTFSFAGAGAQVFGGAGGKSDTPKKGDGESSGDEGEAVAENDTHDPHFEPIIALPDMVEVRTGEEDEEKLFCQRAKLYRFDITTKEWKERGVGEMKILRHPETGTCRLLLRREQVHKVVLNQRLTAELAMNPLATSDKAWCWGGMNYAEEPDGVLEELAIRFKNPEQAQEFLQTVQSCQQNMLSEGLSASQQSESQNVEAEDNDEYEEDDDDEDSDDYDEEDWGNGEISEVLFQVEGSLIWEADDVKRDLHGDLRVVRLTNNTYWLKMNPFDDTDGSKDFQGIMLRGDCEVQRQANSCTWNVEDDMDNQAVQNKYTIIFSTDQEAEQFQDIYYQVATEIVAQTYQYVEETVED